jgi:hypothetical protein
MLEYSIFDISLDIDIKVEDSYEYRCLDLKTNII